MMLNGIEPAPDARGASSPAATRGAIVDLLQADGGYVRDGAWYSALYLLGGLGAAVRSSRCGATRPPADAVHAGGALAGVAYVLALPVFSAFRLELVLVPMAAFGLALGATGARRASAGGPERVWIRVRGRSVGRAP